MTQLTALDVFDQGVRIPLADGTDAPLRYSLRSFALLEARFGSVAAVQEAIDTTGDGTMFGPLIDVLGAGLIGPGGFEPHIREYQDAAGERRVSSITYYRVGDRAELGTLLDPREMDAYGDALNTAISGAFGSQGNDQAAAAEEVPLPPETTATRGLTTSTSASPFSTSTPSAFSA